MKRKKVKPLSQTFINVKFDSQKDGNFLLEPNNLFTFKTSLRPSCGVISRSNKRILISNPTEREISIYRNTKIAFLTELKEFDGINCLNIIDAQKLKLDFSQIRINDKISEKDQAKICAVISEFSDVFSKSDEDLGVCNKVAHEIITTCSKPITQRPYRVSAVERSFIRKQVEQFIENGIASPSNSPWASPVVLVRKKDGSIRFCVDYRKLNDVTESDSYPLPRIDDTIDALGNAKFFSTLDLTSGFWQLEMDENSKQKTAFSTPDGHFEFNVLPFGLKNGPASFQRCMDLVLSKVK